jgi:hypothetical protein
VHRDPDVTPGTIGACSPNLLSSSPPSSLSPSSLSLPSSPNRVTNDTLTEGTFGDGDKKGKTPVSPVSRLKSLTIADRQSVVTEKPERSQTPTFLEGRGKLGKRSHSFNSKGDSVNQIIDSIPVDSDPKITFSIAEHVDFSAKLSDGSVKGVPMGLPWHTKEFSSFSDSNQKMRDHPPGETHRDAEKTE